jgi:type II/III secretion system protein
MTPRVTLDGDIILDMTLDDSALGGDQTVAGVTVPSFVQRKVTTRLRLRDGESNLLAGLIQERESNSVTGFPGAIHLPFFRQLLSGNNRTSDQVEIVMLLTPHIVRTQELTESDLKPIYIGSQQNLGIGGAPPLFAIPPPAEEPAAAPPAAGAPGAAVPGTTQPTTLRGPGGTTVAPPPGSTPVPGTVLVPPAPAAPATGTPPAPAPLEPAVPVPPTPPGATPTPGTTPAPVTPTPAQPGATPTPPPPAAPGTTPAPPVTPAGPPITSPGIGQAQVIISPTGTTFRVGGGPYLVPISISGATRISTLTLTLTFDATRLRVRTVQEGSFMRAGGVTVAFNQQVTGNRIDITLARAADATGASGAGLLAAVLFDAIAPGAATLTLSGTATGPGGTAMGLQFTPVTVTVQQ